MGRLLAGVLSLSVLLFSLSIEAQDAVVAEPDPLDEAEARSHFDAGYSYFQEARYDDALTEFTRAYELSPRPALLFNMSQCYERLGRLDEAIRYLEQFIHADPADRAFQERRLANLRVRQQGDTPDMDEPSELIAPDSARDVTSSSSPGPGGAGSAEPATPSRPLETPPSAAGATLRLRY